MHPYDMARRLVANFGKLLGLPDLGFQGGTHSCALEFDGNVVVNLEFHEPSGQVVISAVLREAPVPEPALLARELMTANLTEYLDGGITLGLEPRTGHYLLMQARAIETLDDAGFEKMVERFLNRAEHWKARIQAYAAGEAAPPEPVPAAAPTATPLPAGAHLFG